MKKNILLLALAGSLFVSQPAKTISSSVEYAAVSMATVLMGVYFVAESLSTNFKAKDTGRKTLRKMFEMMLFLGCGFASIDAGIKVLDKK